MSVGLVERGMETPEGMVQAGEVCLVRAEGGDCKGTPNTPLRSPFQSSGATQKPIQYYYVILGLTPIIPRALCCHPAHFPCSDPGYQCRDAKTL